MSLPRPVLAALRLLIRDPLAHEVIVGDLEEELAVRRAAGRPVSIWVWRQALASGFSCWRSWGLPALAWPGRWQDVSHGLRLLRRAPAFTVVAVATVAVGIAGATTVFSLVDAVLLSPLGYRDPDRLVLLSTTGGTNVPSTIGFETLHDWREQSRSFESLELMRDWQPTLVDGEAERVQGVRLTAGGLKTLGVTPALGRDFTVEDDHPDRRYVMLLTDAFWHRRFGGDPAVLGRFLNLAGRQFQIIGVLPPSFDPTLLARATGGSAPIEILAPLGYQIGQPFACRSCQHLQAFGRLAPGVTLQSAKAELAAIHGRLVTAFPRDYSDPNIAMRAADELVTAQARPALGVLAGAVAFLLLIACANVASLLLARGSARGREVRIRVALGAGRDRLVAQLLTESLLLAGLGGLLGLGLAKLAVAAVVAASPARLPRLESATLDFRVLTFALAATLLSAVVFGLGPALGLSRESSAGDESGRRTLGSARQTRGRRVLVVANVALAFVLLVGAGLMVASVDRLLAVDPGFDRHGVLTLQMSLSGDRFSHDQAIVAGQEEILARVKALPGVEAAAFSGQVPHSGSFDTWGMEVEGRAVREAEDRFDLQRYSVTPEYFAVLKVRLLEGRLLLPSDRAESEPVLLVSETAARQLFPGASALGKRLRFDGGDEEPWRTIVGVVRDVRHEGLSAAVSPQMYLPQSQRADGFVTLALRGAGNLPALVPAIRREVAAVSSEVPIYGVATLDELVSATTARERFTSALLNAFSLAALLLAAVGLYGLIAYLVEGRRQEVGVRVALGALRQDVARLVLTPGLVLVAAGVALGWGLALGLSRFLGSLLYGVSPADPTTYVTIAGLLAAAAMLAHLAPLARALSVDPVAALRDGG